MGDRDCLQVEGVCESDVGKLGMTCSPLLVRDG